MKAYKKWAKDNLCTKENCYSEWDDGYCAGVREGWKVALEWVRIKVENYTPEDICYFIDEELKEETEDEKETSV